MSRNTVINAIRLSLGLSLLPALAACHKAPPKTTADPDLALQLEYAGDVDVLGTAPTREQRATWVQVCFEDSDERLANARELCDLRTVIPYDPAWIPEPCQSATVRLVTLKLHGGPGEQPVLAYHVALKRDGAECGGGNSSFQFDARTGSLLERLPISWDAPPTRGRPFDDRLAEVNGVETTSIWIQRAREEHASVASFARHLLEMMSLGAPLDLLAAISTAQMDEVRHTELCLEQARAEGCTATLGLLDTQLPPRIGALEIALGVALEGCVNETMAAQEVTLAASEATGSQAAMLAQVAADETEHACLAWRTLGWLWPKLMATEQQTVIDAMQRACDAPTWQLLEPCVDALSGRQAA
jgi:hypothetical protein